MTRTKQGLTAQLSALGRFNSTKALAAAAAPGAPAFPPALVVHGTDDRVVPIENGRSLATRAPGAQLLEWGGAGHFFWLDRTQLLVERIGAFLASHDH